VDFQAKRISLARGNRRDFEMIAAILMSACALSFHGRAYGKISAIPRRLPSRRAARHSARAIAVD
jgi:hypothetical protein